MEVEVDAADGAVVFFEAVDYGADAVVPSLVVGRSGGWLNEGLSQGHETVQQVACLEGTLTIESLRCANWHKSKDGRGGRPIL